MVGNFSERECLCSEGIVYRGFGTVWRERVYLPLGFLGNSSIVDRLDRSLPSGLAFHAEPIDTTRVNLSSCPPRIKIHTSGKNVQSGIISSVYRAALLRQARSPTMVVRGPLRLARQPLLPESLYGNPDPRVGRKRYRSNVSRVRKREALSAMRSNTGDLAVGELFGAASFIAMSVSQQYFPNLTFVVEHNSSLYYPCMHSKTTIPHRHRCHQEIPYHRRSSTLHQMPSFP